MYWLKAPLTVAGKTYPAGTIYIPAKPTTQAAAREAGGGDRPELRRDRRQAGAARRSSCKPVRIGLWDRYGGSMDSGWIRWMFEQAFPTTFEVVYAPALDAGNLNAKYDVIIFPDGGIPAAGPGGGGRGGGGRRLRRRRSGRRPGRVRGHRSGNVTAATTIPKLREFVENGGTIIAIGSSTSIAYHFGLPVGERPGRAAAGRDRAATGLARSSTCRARSCRSRWTTRTRWPTAWARTVDVFYDNSPTFRLEAGRRAEGRAAGGLVRQRDAAQQRLGLGPGVPGGRRRGVRGSGRQGQGLPVRTGDHLPRPSRTGRSSSSSTGSTTGRRRTVNLGAVKR